MVFARVVEARSRLFEVEPCSCDLASSDPEGTGASDGSDGALGGSWLSRKIDGSDALGDDGDYQGLLTHNPRPEMRALRVAWR